MLTTRQRSSLSGFAALAGLVVALGLAGHAAAYTFPSTNEANRVAGFPHVVEVSTGPGTVTLRFVNDTNSLAFFEYRIDGAVAGVPPHPVLGATEPVYPGVCVDGRPAVAPDCDPGPVEESFTAASFVEVRLALGGERDWDFDWVRFDVDPLPADPERMSDCRNGGWQDFGFRNQGQCIRFVVTGMDSRVSPFAGVRAPRQLAEPTVASLGPAPFKAPIPGSARYR